MGGTCGTYGGEEGACSVWEGGNQREGDKLEVLGVDGCIILKWILGEIGCGSLAGFLWLRMGRGGGVL